MDRLDIMVAIAQLRLRLDMVERCPHLLETQFMIDIKRPIELAGMAARLKRAEKMEQDLAATGKRYDTVLDAIDDKHKSLQGHVGSLESTNHQLEQVISRMVAGSNNPPNDGSESSQGSIAGEGQVISSETQKA